MRISIYIIILLLCSVNIHAQFLLAEDFSGHDAGSAVDNAQNPNEPEVGEWVSVEESIGSTFPVVVDEQLSYTDYIFSATGKTMYTVPTDGVRNTVMCLSKTHLPYPCQPEGEFIEGSNEYYTAFILDLSNTVAGDAQEIFSYYQLNTGIRRGSIFYKLSEDKNTVSFSFQKNPATPSTSWTKYYDKSKPVLMVVKYGHVCINEKNLGHAEFELFINPNPKKTEEENSNLRVAAYGNNKGFDTDMRYVNFRQSGQTSMKVAGIRIGNSFEKVLFGTGSSLPGIINKDLLFYADSNTLLPNKVLNGQLSVYDISSSLLCTYVLCGKVPVRTELKSGAYILLYEESGDKYVQKIIIK